MVSISSYDHDVIKEIEFPEEHFLFQNPFIQTLDLTKPITIRYEILEYFRYLKINDNINLDEIIDLIEMLCFDVEIKKKILTPFLKEYKNKQLLKYFDEFDIYLFQHDQL